MDYQAARRRLRAVLREFMGLASLEDALLALIRDERADAVKGARRMAVSAVERLGLEDPSARSLMERDVALREMKENWPWSRTTVEAAKEPGESLSYAGYCDEVDRWANDRDAYARSKGWRDSAAMNRHEEGS